MLKQQIWSTRNNPYMFSLWKYIDKGCDTLFVCCTKNASVVVWNSIKKIDLDTSISLELIWIQAFHRNWSGYKHFTGIVLDISISPELIWIQAFHRNWSGYKHFTGIDLDTSISPELIWIQAFHRNWSGYKHFTGIDLDTSISLELFWIQAFHWNFEPASSACQFEVDSKRTNTETILWFCIGQQLTSIIGEFSNNEPSKPFLEYMMTQACCTNDVPTGNKSMINEDDHVRFER